MPTGHWPGSGTPAAPYQPGQPSYPAGVPAATMPPGPQHSPAYAYTSSPGYGAPPPKKKSSTGLIIGAIVAVLLIGMAAIIGVVALADGGDDESTADDTTSETVTTPPTDPVTTPVTTDPALTLQGSGYTYQFPNGDWKDLTADTPDSTGTIDTIAAPGDSIATARGNILVETSSAYGETDVNNLVDGWKTVLSGSTGATPTDIDGRTIGGKEAVGVELEWTNENNFDVHQVAYLVISGEEQYSITASFRQGDSGFRETFDAVLDTWVWEE